MKNGQNLSMCLKMGGERGIRMAPSFLSWGSSHCHNEVTSEVENSWEEVGFVSCVCVCVGGGW